MCIRDRRSGMRFRQWRGCRPCKNWSGGSPEAGWTLTAYHLSLIHIYLPEGQLKKAISNILSNAVNYTEAGQSILVVFDKNKLSVSNECSVLPPEQLQHIVEPFYRPDLAHSQATGGNGLGLYIVQTILDKLRLKYQFVLMPNDRGMSFTIQFWKKSLLFEFRRKSRDFFCSTLAQHWFYNPPT